MRRKKVFIKRQIPEESIKSLREQFDVQVNPHDRAMSRKELLTSVKGMDAVLCMVTDTKEVL